MLAGARGANLKMLSVFRHAPAGCYNPVESPPEEMRWRLLEQKSSTWLSLRDWD
jgi:hypothetical protein